MILEEQAMPRVQEETVTLARVAQYTTAMVRREFTPRVAIGKTIWDVEVRLIMPLTIPRVAPTFPRATKTSMAPRVAIFQPLEVITRHQTSALEITARVESLDQMAIFPLQEGAASILHQTLVATLPRVAMVPPWMSISPPEAVVTRHLI